METRMNRHTVMRAALALMLCLGMLSVGMLCAGSSMARAEDDIDRIQQRGTVPPHLRRQRGYSDFTDPLGRFLDLVAAGDLTGARAIQPNACATWAETRQNSAFSGKVWVWDTELDLDKLCAAR